MADSIQGVFPTYRSYYDLQVSRANHYLLVTLGASRNDAGRYTCSTFDDTGTTAHAYADISVISKRFNFFCILFYKAVAKRLVRTSDLLATALALAVIDKKKYCIHLCLTEANAMAKRSL